MKKALFVLAAVTMAASAFAQGTIVFQNRNIPTASGSGTYNVPIWEYNPAVGIQQNGAGDLAGGVTVGLFTQGGTLIGSSLLRTDVAPSLNSSFFATAAQTLTVPNSAPGSTPTLLVRAWQGADFAAAKAGTTLQWMDETTNPENTFTSRALGGTPAGGGLPITPPGMTGWGNENGQGLELFQNVPEPSSIALGVLGVGAVALMRRRK